LGGVFPSDFAVAKVPPNGVQFKQGDPFVTVFAEPLVDYEKVREVLLVWPVKQASQVVTTGATSDAR
ncbi:MAG: rod shape-determining protein MreC, partial [Thiothrix sp.]